jgi:hypothetical protein
MTYYTSFLNQIGLKAQIKVIADANYFTTIGTVRLEPQTGLADWSQDFPNPIEFYLLLDGKAILPTDNENFDQVNDPRINAAITQLGTVPGTQLSRVVSKWQAVDEYVVGPTKAQGSAWDGALRRWLARSQRRSGQGGVGRAVAAAACDRHECPEQHALHHDRRLAEHDDVSKLSCDERQLERVRHAAPVHVSFAREPEQRLDHVSEPLTRRDLDADDRVHVTFVPPVVPYPGLDVGALTGAYGRPLSVAEHRQLALSDGEALLQRGVQMFTDDACAGQRGHVGDSTARAVPPWRLEQDSTLKRYRVLPHLAGLDRPQIRSRSGIGMRHAQILRHGGQRDVRHGEVA